ncbi:MAG: polysaccharide biosynthesis/export family protein [Bacteroidia bacterium]|nr:polysaccharide biosynthesis/export family protein [Bacteroidia bacterium]
MIAELKIERKIHVAGWLWVMISGIILLGGCSYKNKSILFKTEEKLKIKGIPVYHVNGDNIGSSNPPDHVIATDDRIAVRFLNNFDLESGVTIAGSATQGQELSFLVDRNGEVVLPIIGRVKLLGYTRMEASAKLEKLYSVQIQNPVIDVSILSRTVSVLGEVATPGLYELNRQRVTLIEMIAKAGGITKFGKKKNIKIIRQKSNGERELIIFNLTKESSLSASEMILQDKDIIYIEPRSIALVAEAVTPYTSLLSILVSIGTLAVVFSRLTP